MNKWEEKKLGEICDIVAGGTPNTSNKSLWNGEIAWITPADLSNYSFRYIKHGERNITQLGLKKSAARLLPKGTILLTTRAPIGYVAIASSELSTNQGFKNLICDETKVKNAYIYYWLKQNISILQNFASGATFPELSGSTLKKIKILLPELSVQKRIADILSNYDDLIENNNRRIAILEKAAQNLYKEWFVRFRFPGHEHVKFENGLPQGWEVKKLGEIATILMGQSPESIYYNDEMKGLPFHQGVSNFGNRFPVHQIYCTKEKKIANENDILLSVRAPVGRLNIANTKIIIGRGLCAINHKDKHNTFLYYQLLSYFHKEDIIGNGSIFNSVGKDELYKIKLTIPTNKLIQQFENIVCNIDNQLNLLDIQIKNLKKQRDLLLPRLMSGRLEV